MQLVEAAANPYKVVQFCRMCNRPKNHRLLRRFAIFYS
jgi:hypothetical protein